MRGEPGGILERVFQGALSEADVTTLAAGLRHGDAALAERAAEELHRASLLVQVVNAVTGLLSLDALLPRLIELITEVLGAERATLFLHDRDTAQLFSREI